MVEVIRVVSSFRLDDKGFFSFFNLNYIPIWINRRRFYSRNKNCWSKAQSVGENISPPRQRLQARAHYHCHGAAHPENEEPDANWEIVEFPVAWETTGDYKTRYDPDRKHYQLPGFEAEHLKRLVEDYHSLNVTQNSVSSNACTNHHHAGGGPPTGGPPGGGPLEDPGGPPVPGGPPDEPGGPPEKPPRCESLVPLEKPGGPPAGGLLAAEGAPVAGFAAAGAALCGAACTGGDC